MPRNDVFLTHEFHCCETPDFGCGTVRRAMVRTRCGIFSVPGRCRAATGRRRLVHHLSALEFAKFRAKLSETVVPALNDWLIARVGKAGNMLPPMPNLVFRSPQLSHLGRRPSADQIASSLQ